MYTDTIGGGSPAPQVQRSGPGVIGYSTPPPVSPMSVNVALPAQVPVTALTQASPSTHLGGPSGPVAPAAQLGLRARSGVST